MINILEYQWIVHGAIKRALKGRSIPGEDYEDLEGEGWLALWKAALQFDPGRGNKFSSYAWPSVCGMVKRAYIKQMESKKMTRPLSEINGNGEVEFEDLSVMEGMLNGKGLSFQERKVLELCFGEDIGMNEIAKKLGVCLATAYNIKGRGLYKLRKDKDF